MKSQKETSKKYFCFPLKNVYCDVHGVYYECSGIPQQFYLSGNLQGDP